MKCLAVNNWHSAELLGDATAVVNSLERVTLEFLQKLGVVNSDLSLSIKGLFTASPTAFL